MKTTINNIVKKINKNILLIQLGSILLGFIIIIVIILILFKIEWSPADLSINLLTEILGIIITVFLIERIMEGHRTRIWNEAQYEISLRLKMFIINSLLRIRSKPDDLLFPESSLFTAEAFSEEFPKFKELYKHKIEMIDKMVETFTIEQWASFEENIRHIQKETESIILLFGEKITASEYKYLLNINTISTRIFVWCPMLEENISTNPDWVPTSTALRHSIAKDIKILVQTILDFGNAL